MPRGRKKRKENPVSLPSPVRIADALLYAEHDIRRTVNEEQQALFSIGGSNPDGSGRGSGLCYSDRTGAAAVKLADGLPYITLSNGLTIKHPEAWLSVFEAVREKARQCQRPQMIFDAWAAEYEGKILFVDSETANPQTWRNIKRWIRYQVLTEARAAGLVDFDEEEIMESIDKAGLEWICEH